MDTASHEQEAMTLDGDVLYRATPSAVITTILTSTLLLASRASSLLAAHRESDRRLSRRLLPRP